MEASAIYRAQRVQIVRNSAGDDCSCALSCLNQNVAFTFCGVEWIAVATTRALRVTGARGRNRTLQVGVSTRPNEGHGRSICSCSSGTSAGRLPLRSEIWLRLRVRNAPSQIRTFKSHDAGKPHLDDKTRIARRRAMGSPGCARCFGVVIGTRPTALTARGSVPSRNAARSLAITEGSGARSGRTCRVRSASVEHNDEVHAAPCSVDST